MSRRGNGFELPASVYLQQREKERFEKIVWQKSYNRTFAAVIYVKTFLITPTKMDIKSFYCTLNIKTHYI